jgi:homoserine kinase
LEAVTAYAPGSASNLGPGFDCLGLAFTGKGDQVTARRAARAGVRVESISDARIPKQADRNTAAIAAQAVLARAGSAAGLELSIQKGLPLAGGMGGSAASAVAGAVAADALIGSRLTREDLLACALQAEAAVAGRHLDNIAPSLYGGAMLVVGIDPPQLTHVSVHASIGMVLVTPAYEVRTAEARAALPAHVARGDAIAQAGHLARLVLGLERGDPELLRSCLEDRIALPVRLRLFPGFEQARGAALAAGAHGACVSGAGPTALALCEAAKAGPVGAAMAGAYSAAGHAAVVHVAQVDAYGARLLA